MSNNKISTEPLAIHMDGPTQTVTFKQRRSQFDVNEQVVTVPIAAIKTIMAQHLMAEVQASGVVEQVAQQGPGATHGTLRKVQ